MIKKKILNYLSKKSSSNPEVKPSYDRSRKTAIVFTEEQDNEALIELTQGLISDGKEIHTLMMVENPPKDASYPHPHLSEKDISLTGKVSAERLQGFFNTQFDLLLVLNETQSSLTRFVISKSNAPLRAGYLSDDHSESLLNLMIKPNDTSHHSELLAYLRKIA